MPPTSHASARAGIRLEAHPEKDHLVLCHVRVPDAGCVGHRAKLTIARAARVKDSRPVHGRAALWETEFEVRGPEHTFAIPRSRLGRGYAYDGRQIEIRLESKLVVDDGLLFDTTIEGAHRLRILDRPALSGEAEELAEPDDAFDFFANLAAIPTGARSLTVLLAVAGGLLMALNALVGLHDQLTPDPATWLYSHTDADGDSQSPLVNALMGSGALGAVVWLAMRRQLRKYMVLQIHPRLPRLGRDTVVPARDLVRGSARVPLEHVRLRVVAYNRELGQYRRGSGTNERTVSFAVPVRAVVLYEQAIPFLPAGRPIGEALEGEVRFAPLFAALYPPCMVTKTHGVDVRWEVQLLHPDFVDQEQVRDGSDLPFDAFLEG